MSGERFMQELYACEKCGWWGADPRSRDWASLMCQSPRRDLPPCDGVMRRGTFILVEVGDPVCVSCGKPRSAHGAHTGAFAGTTGARLLCNDFRQFEGRVLPGVRE